MVEEQKENDKFRTEYLSMNLHDRDITRKAFAEGKEEGISQGAEQKAIETAKNLILKNIPLEIIAECTALPFHTVQKLKESL